MKREVKAKAKRKKGEYEKPKVVYERKLEALGGVCADSTAGGGCSLLTCTPCGSAS